MKNLFEIKNLKILTREELKKLNGGSTNDRCVPEGQYFCASSSNCNDGDVCYAGVFNGVIQNGECCP